MKDLSTVANPYKRNQQLRPDLQQPVIRIGISPVRNHLQKIKLI